VQLTGGLLDGGVPLWFVYGGALCAALHFTYRAAVRSLTRVMEDMATIALCLQLTILCLCLTGPVFNTQIGILFWGITGGLFGAVRASTARHNSDLEDAVYES
jgi:hypothetical protein